MKNFITNSLSVLLVLLICATAYSQSRELADKYWNMAEKLKKEGRYLEAAQMYAKSAEAEKKSPNPRLVYLTKELNQAGDSYFKVGQYNKAIKCYVQTLVICKKLGTEAGVATALINIGSVYKVWGQYDKAIKYYEQALKIDKKLRKEAGVALQLNNIGEVYRVWGQYDKAIKYFKQALAINKKLGKEGQVAIQLNNIGLVYSARGQYNQAIKYCEQALAIDKKLGKEDGVASDLNNIGMVYYTLNKYNKAIKNFTASVELKEKLRKTATGDVRRDYLASQICTYQSLTSTYIRKNDIPKAFATIELSRAKLLAERIAGAESKINIPSVQQIQKELPEDTAVLVYANVDVGSIMVQIVIMSRQIYGTEISDKEFMTSALEKYKTPIKTMLKSQRGIKIVKKYKQQKKAKDKGKIDFNDIINYYRSILTDPSSQYNRGIKVAKKEVKYVSTPKENRISLFAGCAHRKSVQPTIMAPTTLTEKDKISKIDNSHNFDYMLYSFLIKPLEKHIKNKKRLIIVPDGILGFLPFETLKDDNGNYLAKTYSISYAQSMGVLDIIKKRKYNANRKPLLAFGGAVYDNITYSADMIQNEKQLAVLDKNTHASFEEKRSVRNAYASLDMANWDNLPGTLEEVKNIAKVVRGAKVYTGDKVNENNLKKLSANGSLANYKIVHFATHGLVVPAIPELSAIVLSQFKNERGGEDGYLRMGEIAKLKIKANFINLSACETGLGKIYGGEGVVGLTQSFLIAGANGLSVSLWQVSDVSTSQFMVAMYELVEKQGIGYAEAITEIKRQFIRGDFGETYRAPYYWAPFVYYGM